MKQVYKNDWISVYKGLDRASIKIGPASYFDDRAHISFTPTILLPFIGLIITGLTWWSLIWLPFFIYGYGHLYVDIPIRSGIDECDPPQYGFYWYGDGPWYRLNAFVRCWKDKTKHHYMPWSWEWSRTSKMKYDGTWMHDTKKSRTDFYKQEIKDQIWHETYPYTYVLKNGKIQQRFATVCVEEREWKWRLFQWLPFPKMVRKTINVDFSYGGPIEREILFEKIGHPIKQNHSGEVGERAGDWKGGTLGCSYLMKGGETPLDTLRRMEREREFT